MDASISRVTAGRWRNGQAVPSAAQQQIVFAALKKRVTKALKDPTFVPKRLSKDERNAALRRLDDRLQHLLSADPSEIREGFTEALVDGMTLLGMKDPDVAQEIHGSRNTVNGWRCRARTPAETVCRAVYEGLRRRIAKTIKESQP
jgi:hypothetical protein